MLQIIPPDLVAYNSSRYYLDLDYRQEVDNENYGEKRERLNLLFHTLLLNALGIIIFFLFDDVNPLFIIGVNISR